MVDLIFRAATQDDFPAIRELIHEVGINPTGLDWRRFLVAVRTLSPSGTMQQAQGDAIDLAGCGQVKPHRDGSRELASLAVREQDRGQGVARTLIQLLLEGQPRPIHLMCRARLGSFYNRYGFHAIGPEEMPPYFRRVAKLVRLFNHSVEDGLLVMRLD